MKHKESNYYCTGCLDNKRITIRESKDYFREVHGELVYKCLFCGCPTMFINIGLQREGLLRRLRSVEEEIQELKEFEQFIVKEIGT